VGVEGLEAISVNGNHNNDLRETAFPSGANSGAVDARDPDLAHLIAAWPTLPEPIRLAVLALVDAATT
jgi:hypothetical protein